MKIKFYLGWRDSEKVTNLQIGIIVFVHSICRGDRKERNYYFINILQFEELNCESEVKAAQSCPTLWDPMDYTVHGILQVRMLE